MRRLIQVCGDPTVDWLRIHNEDVIVRGGVYFWQKQPEDSKVRMSSKSGGSAFVLNLLQEMILPEIAQVEGASLKEDLLNQPKNIAITTSWTVWRKFANPGFNTSSYRLAEWQEFEPGSWDYPLHKLSGFPDLLVIQDNGLGFRTCPEGWPEAISGQSRAKLPEHIILKLGQYSDGQQNPMLDRIAELGLSPRTTIVTSLSDLRSCPVKVGISLSWERMLEEVVNAVRSENCPFWDEGKNRLKYRQIILTIGASGAVIVENGHSTLIFDRRGQEGDFAARYPGQMMGYNTCLIGALAAAWADSPEQVDWTEAACMGIGLARLLHIRGYDVFTENQQKQLRFPSQMIASAYRRYKEPGCRDSDGLGEIFNLGVFIDQQGLVTHHRTCGSWTILENRLLTNQTEGRRAENMHQLEAVSDCAGNIVLLGPEAALLDVPIETIGAWCSADRQEVEGVRSVSNAMKNYLQMEKPEKPLCVAVFGPPGAGKSFVIKEIARGLGMGEDAQLTFNLSQIEQSGELLTAFHQIRDLNLKGKTPLVFWDEFDTPCEGQALGWLHYFLAPMQDGEFRDQGRSHPLGGGIYVFAGATNHSFEEFRRGNNMEDRNAKKPDFISRLRAYINIRGINADPNTVEDRLFMIRRAFILRQYLEINAPQIRNDQNMDVDDGVLNAFLRVTEYLHGARSMENLVKMSSLYDKRKYELSSLPPDDIIKMHVNKDEFNALTRLGHQEMLRIGISGHIHLDPARTGEIQEAVKKAIDFIERQFPDRYLTVFSPLAIGSDRLVARELLKKDNSRLIAVLPVPEEEYINDFGLTDDYWVDKAGAELRREFKYWLSKRAIEVINIPPLPTRKAAYIEAGYFIAEHSDVMIVVWDGQDNPESSVTAQITARAERLQKPICHIWACNYRQDLLLNNMDHHGEIRCRNFPGKKPGEWQ